MRFRKSVKICKVVKLNLSKSGASVSLGGKGLTLNLGGQGARVTVGLPGTGLSYSTKIGGKKKKTTKGKDAAGYGNTTKGELSRNTSAKANGPDEKEIDRLIEESVEENARFVNIYELAPKVDTLEDFEQRRETNPGEKEIIAALIAGG